MRLSSFTREGKLKTGGREERFNKMSYAEHSDSLKLNSPFPELSTSASFKLTASTGKRGKMEEGLKITDK